LQHNCCQNVILLKMYAFPIGMWFLLEHSSCWNVVQFTLKSNSHQKANIVVICSKNLKPVIIVTTVGNPYSNQVNKNFPWLTTAFRVKSFCICWSYYNSFVPNKMEKCCSRMWQSWSRNHFIQKGIFWDILVNFRDFIRGNAW
jgi:hypothetical protein